VTFLIIILVSTLVSIWFAIEEGTF